MKAAILHVGGKFLLALLVGLVVAGCAATVALPEAQSVEIVNEPPDKTKCKLLGEVVGSQGNWFTGDWTSNKNLVVGARNQLRNETQALGGNLVYVQDMKNTNAWGSLGTTNTTAIGMAYLCKHM